MTAPPFPSVAHPSLEAVLPEVEAASILKKIYPRDIFPNPKTVRLPLGNTAYWVFGPNDGPKVVLVHGITTPSMMWRYLAPLLAENGFRVLVYDLYGRGYSDAPEATYDTNLYITQLALLLQHVQFPQAHIIGLSMGGGVAAAFAAIFPNLVTSKVILIASVGLIEIHADTELTPPREFIYGKTSSSGEVVQDIRSLQAKCLPGYPHAVTSSFREGPLRGLENAYKSISETSHLKVQIIHGTADQTVSMKYGLKIKELLPDAELVSIEGADHDLVVADGIHDKVEAAILSFLRD